MQMQGMFARLIIVEEGNCCFVYLVCEVVMLFEGKYTGAQMSLAAQLLPFCLKTTPKFKNNCCSGHCLFWAVLHPFGPLLETSL